MTEISAHIPAAKHAIVTIITDNFIGLGATFLASLKKHMAAPEPFDLILLTNRDYAPLSDDNRKLLSRIFGTVHFLEAPSDHLNEINTRRYDKHGTHIAADVDARVPAKRAVFVKLSLLLLAGYERCVWFDSDMLVLADVSELFALPHGIAVVSAGAPDRRFGVGLYRKGHNFNSGLMVLDARHRGEAMFAKAVAILNTLRSTRLQDQSVLNRLYGNHAKLFLPHSYNWKMVSRISDDFREEIEALACARVVHFVSNSKWRLKEPAEGSPLAAHFHAIRREFDIPGIIEM